MNHQNLSVAELRELLNNRLATLRTNREYAVARGDVAHVLQLDNEITETEATLSSQPE